MFLTGVIDAGKRLNIGSRRAKWGGDHIQQQHDENVPLAQPVEFPPPIPSSFGIPSFSVPDAELQAARVRAAEKPSHRRHSSSVPPSVVSDHDSHDDDEGALQPEQTELKLGTPLNYRKWELEKFFRVNNISLDRVEQARNTIAHNENPKAILLQSSQWQYLAEIIVDCCMDPRIKISSGQVVNGYIKQEMRTAKLIQFLKHDEKTWKKMRNICRWLARLKAMKVDSSEKNSLGKSFEIYSWL